VGLSDGPVHAYYSIIFHFFPYLREAIRLQSVFAFEYYVVDNVIDIINIKLFELWSFVLRS